jgi:drug/metabolite transporter (DMT)-like permease
LAIAIAILLWSSAYVAIRAGLQGYSPEGLALLRYLVASVCIGIIYYRMPARNSMRLKDILVMMCLGAVGIGFYNIALNYGELTVSSGMASFIISQAPVMTALLAMVFLGERLTLSHVAGFLVSIFGVTLITLGEEGGFNWTASIAYVFLAALAGSCFTLLQKPYLKRYHAIEATTYVIWGGTLFLCFYAPKLQQDLMHASLLATCNAIYLGVFPAAIGYVAWSYVLSNISAARAMSFLYFTPFIATLLGWIFLGEVPVALSVAGGLLAMVGVWLTNQSYRRI